MCFQLSVIETLLWKKKIIKVLSVSSSLLIPMSNKSLKVYRLIFCMCLKEVTALLDSFHLGLVTAWLLGFGHILLSVELHLKLTFFCKLLLSHNSFPRTFPLFGVVIHFHPPSINSTPAVVSAARCLAWCPTSLTL